MPRMTARGGLPADDELVAGLRAGDDALFGLVLDAWSAGMLRLARAFVSTPDSAAEVVQDAWLGVIEGIDRFADRSSLKTWVYRILVNTAKRRRDRESRTVPWSSLGPGHDGPAVDPDRFQARPSRSPVTGGRSPPRGPPPSSTRWPPRRAPGSRPPSSDYRGASRW
jgi:RNA polymerase sigma-70 factor (ECF subfamily)